MLKEKSALARVVGAVGTSCACAVAGCEIPTTGRKPFCSGHWHALPGRQRSRVSQSLSVDGNPFAARVIARTASMLATVAR